MQVYYLNRERFTEGDTKKAFAYAKQLIKEDANIDTITFLVYQQNQYYYFLKEMGFSKDELKNHGFTKGRFKFQIHTVKTYEPGYMFAGHGAKEILIAVGVPPKELIKFEDKSNIKACIIAPWQLAENEEFLQIHEAKDLESGKVYPNAFNVDQRVINAIGWLKATSFPNEGYHHPNDKERLHQMANALAHYNVPIDYASVVYFGLHNGLIPSSARLTAEAFVRAQDRKFALRGEANYTYMKQMMEEEHNE